MDLFKGIDEYLDKSWDLLFQASKKRNDPMRLPVMGTSSTDGNALRVIVLRDVYQSDRLLRFFTDIRSDKVEQIQNNSSVSLCFWHNRKNLQIRTIGNAIIQHGSPLTKKYWDRLSIRGRMTYATTLAPGSPSHNWTTGLPDFWSDNMEMEKTAFAYENFCLIDVTVSEIDCLHLHPDGHQRAAFSWVEDSWKKKWLIP